MHAITTKKWTFKRYPEMKALLESYGVDTNVIEVTEEWITDYK
jgi:hypothetical protein